MQAENRDIWEAQKNIFFSKKFKELVKEWKQYMKSKGLTASQEALAEEIGCQHRNTVSNWMTGKDYPSPENMERICNFFHISQDYFFPKSINEEELTLKRYHDDMESGPREWAEELGVSDAFLRFIKSDQSLTDELLSNQYTDAILNSFDPAVPDTGSLFQMVNSAGEKAYMTRTTVRVLRDIETEVKKYMSYLIWKAGQEERIKRFGRE